MTDKHVAGHPGCSVTKRAREAIEQANREDRQLTAEEKALVKQAGLR